MSTATKPKHIGRNISRIRELRGMKQEALTIAIGVSQQYISTLEGSETVDNEKLNSIAEVLGVSAEAIESFSDEGVVNYFNNVYDNDITDSIVNANALECTFNPIDKIVELYERLVQAEKDKVEYLERLMKEK